MDVHRDWISTGVLRLCGDEVDTDKIVHDEPSVRRFVRQFGEPGGVWACYEVA